MMPGLITPEIQPRGECHVLGFEKVFAEREGIAAELADIGVQIESTLRFHRNTEAHFTQGRQQVVPTPAKFCATLFENADGCRLETSQRSVLRHAWSTDVEVLGELFQLTDGSVGSHQPSQPPTGHPEILRKTIQ